MPNWCNNHLRITGPAKDVERFKEKAIGHSPWEKPPANVEPEILNFHSLMPIPDEVLKAGYEDAGYDWERNNWGCKWGACEPGLVDEWDGGLIYGFDTAWSPPLPFVEHLSKTWPNLAFILDYEEPGMCFKGLARATNGTLEDHCIEM